MRASGPVLTLWRSGTALESTNVERMATSDQAKSAAGAMWAREKPLFFY
jgi:hypothetical protein